MRLRRAHSDDAPAIAEVHRHAVLAVDHPEYDEAILEAWAPPETEAHLDQVREELEGDELTFFVFENAEGEIVGFSCVHTEEGEIRAVYVAPEARGREMGSALLRQAEWAAAQSEVEEVTLQASLNAVEFYEHHGYRRVGDEVHELSEGREIPCVRMTKELDTGMDETW